MLLRDQQAIIRRHQNNVPVKVSPIAVDLGVPVFSVSQWSDQLSGMLKRTPETSSGYTIYVNANHHPYRKRFTIAHEIGHFILHESLIRDGIVEDSLLRAEGFSNATEAEANRFAADILMPWHLIAREQERGISSVERLAALFEVSKDAMSIRLLGVPYDPKYEAA